MKKIILTLALLFLSTFLFAQRFAYIDSEYILSNIPEYNDAQQEIDNIAVKWQQEIEAQFKEVDDLYRKFQNDAPLLTQENKVKRENEIIQKEKEVKDIQKKRFGNDGDLFKKRQELIRPIQDKVYSAIEKRAQSRNYTFVFDKADNANIMYADQKVDISNEILDDLGYSTKEKKGVSVGVSGGVKTSDVSKTIGK